MTQEEKRLLLKDLCSRLPYGVKFNFSGYDGCDYKMEIVSPITVNNSFPIEDCKPYLRLMSSMTEEEKEEYELLIDCSDYTYFKTSDKVIDWLNARHFDYRGLIEKGLALEASDDMYEEKKN